MKKFILAGLVSLSLAAHAAPEDIVLGIFDIILNEIADDVNGGNNNNNGGGKPSANWNKKVILKDSGKDIVLGRVFITENKSNDTVKFPACGNKKGDNKRVTRLRMFVNNEDVYVDNVRVTFQNGGQQNFPLQRSFGDGDATKWLVLKGNNARCIAEIRVSGELENWGGWNNNGNGWGNGKGKPGNWNKNDRAVLSFVGLKEF